MNKGKEKIEDSGPLVSFTTSAEGTVNVYSGCGEATFRQGVYTVYANDESDLSVEWLMQQITHLTGMKAHASWVCYNASGEEAAEVWEIVRALEKYQFVCDDGKELSLSIYSSDANIIESGIVMTFNGRWIVLGGLKERCAVKAIYKCLELFGIRDVELSYGETVYEESASIDIQYISEALTLTPTQRSHPIPSKSSTIAPQTPPSQHRRLPSSDNMVFPLTVIALSTAYYYAAAMRDLPVKLSDEGLGMIIASCAVWCVYVYTKMHSSDAITLNVE